MGLPRDFLSWATDLPGDLKPVAHLKTWNRKSPLIIVLFHNRLANITHLCLQVNSETFLPK